MNNIETQFVIYSVGIILRNMEFLKGSMFYSEYVMKILEHYDKTKLKGLYKGDDGQSTDGVNMFEIVLRIIIEVMKNNEDEKVVEFYDELYLLADKYGVNKEILKETVIRKE